MDRLELRQDRPATLSLDRLGAGVDEPLGRLDGLCRSFVSLKRQVGGDEAVRLGPGHGADVVLHFFERHVRGVRVAEDDHPQGVADEQQRHPGGVEQPGHGEVVRGQRCDRLAALALEDGLRRLPCLAQAARFPPAQPVLKRKLRLAKFGR